MATSNKRNDYCCYGLMDFPGIQDTAGPHFETASKTSCLACSGVVTTIMSVAKKLSTTALTQPFAFRLRER